MNFNNYISNKLTFKSLDDYNVIGKYNTTICNYSHYGFKTLGFNLTKITELSKNKTNLICVEFINYLKDNDDQILTETIFFNLKYPIEKIIANYKVLQPYPAEYICLNLEDINIVFNFKHL
jgi:hypothetical protein